jgi:NADH-quinone oxidoreductase subunit G
LEETLTGVVVGGVELADLPDPVAARAALEKAGFVLSLEVRISEVTELADVVLPVAPPAEKAGTFVNWEGRHRPFPKALQHSAAWSDAMALDAIAGQLDVNLGVRDLDAVRSEIAELGAWSAEPPAPGGRSAEPPEAAAGQAVLATWRMMLDLGRGQDGEPHLARTARTPCARLSAVTAAEIGVADGEQLTVSTDAGSVTVPVAVTEMPDRVVWLPQNSAGCRVHVDLGVQAGAVVTLSGGEA